MCSLAAGSASAQSKPVRLRSGPFDTPPRGPGNLNAGIGFQGDSATGLFVVQFEGPISTAERGRLRELGISLVQFVPEDAFIARLQNSSTAELLSLPFVRSLSRFRSDQKLHPTLGIKKRPAASDPVAISALVLADATPSDLASLKSQFIATARESRHSFGIVLNGRIATQRLDTLASSESVLWIEAAPNLKLHEESASAIVGGRATNHMTLTQALGYNGAGVTVAVADSGLHNGAVVNHTELLGRTKSLRHYGNLTNAVDEHNHGTHVAGIIAGRGITTEGDEFGYYGLGVAPGSQLLIQRVFDGRGLFQGPPSLSTLARDAARDGAIISNNSWGEDAQGRYDLSAAQFDEFVRDADDETAGDQPMTMVFSAGNAGPGAQSISSPAVAKNVIAVGATQGPRTNFFTYDGGSESLASFSSRGPSEDGRIKPDLVAPGTWIASLLSPFGFIENTWSPINNEFMFMGGTSQSAPHISGAAAVFIQYYRSNFSGSTPSPALVKAALINTAIDVSGQALSAPAPNMDEGWGRGNVARLFSSGVGFEFYDQQTPLATGQKFERSIFVSKTNCPLHITMAYTDVPGFPAAVPALVNNLDLELIGPDGRSYHGNQFALGQSIPGSRARDNVNNVEGIHLANAERGEYVLRIKAQGVNQDARRETLPVDQDFAIVVSGGLPTRGEGLILVDRSAYRAPGEIKIKLIDADAAAQPTIPVTVLSQTEAAGLSITLGASGTPGVFTGTVATAVGPALNDGKLQISHGDWIRVEYLDHSSQTVQFATVAADLQAPLISNVGFTNAFGQSQVGWSTDEPASALVLYGASPIALNDAVTNAALSVGHQIELPNLSPGQTYYFDIVAIDAAGNTTTNSNGGSHFVFTPGANPTILLVDAYEPDPADPDIPRSAYTNPLNEIGIAYDVWDAAAQQALPDYAALRPYSVVIWRINDSFRRSNDSIPPEQQAAIEQYLNAGGSFFLSSMNAITRLLNQGSGAFVTNVLQVRRFVLNPNSFEHCVNCDEDFRVPSMQGLSNDPIGRNISIALDYSNYSVDGLRGPDFSDTFTPSTNAVPILTETISGKPCAIRFPRTGQDSPGRVVFASVPLDAIPMEGPSPNNRTDFLRRVIQFLSPGIGGIGSLALNQSSFTVPDLATIELADSDLAGEGTAIVSVHSDSHPEAVAAILAETARPGLFRGSIPLATAESSSPPEAIKAIHGDALHVVYDDVSNSESIEVSANVDALVPGISGMTVRAGYFDALISWTSSEPTDALVQFGESSFLGRTEYRSEPRLGHSIRLIALVPDRTYYFKLAVRDQAGNVTFADNGGQLFSFQTLPPLQPNFTDSMEGPATNWVVVSTDDSQRVWSTGPPNDGHTAMAYSGVNVWASNLYGEPADIIDTYLISPAIDLRGANVAELRFQNDYNFTDRTGFDYINRGRLLISTNVQTDPIPIAEYGDFIFDWNEEVVDLTAYAGRVVFLIWHHQMRSASPEPPVERPGWAIDDIRVTASNVPAGSIRVTNNISQARFELRRGGLVQTGQGIGMLFTNLPLGTYAVSFGNVPFYSTPGPKTNSLVSSSQILVTGNYTFADANSNGMSDAWELEKFGNVSPTRTRTTDSDMDGFPDLAEFTAGTDPLLANSSLRLASPFQLSGTLVRFTWPSTPGRLYQLQGSYGSGSWIQMSSWIRASSDSTTVILPTPNPVDPHLYRLEVRP